MWICWGLSDNRMDVKLLDIHDQLVSPLRSFRDKPCKVDE
jgi:hypothetical protein